ncbi:MAG: ribbon-helix-helix protein, CopG family [Hyphomicrobium sp.]|jgi:metal-responsive CopG/Arc/MetJ family transcriptional regulator
MNGLARETRLQIMLDDDELAAIDDWRFKQRMPSRAAAIRELLRRGLQAELGANFGRNRRSGDFGVIGEDEQEQT